METTARKYGSDEVPMNGIYSPFFLAAFGYEYWTEIPEPDILCADLVEKDIACAYSY